MARVFRRDGAFWIDFSDADGVRRRRRIGPSKRVAREVLDGLLGSVARRQYLGIIDDSATDFADFAEKIWWPKVSATIAPRTAERWRGILDNHLRPHFTGLLRSITLEAVESYVASRLKPVICPDCEGKKKIAGIACSECEGAGERAVTTPSTVNRELAVLRHILKRAVAWHHLHRYLLQGWRPLKEPSGRCRFLSLDEIPRLIVACGESRSSYLKPFVLVALNTGMRRGEILSLTRRSIDWTNRFLTLTKTKNGESRTVYLNDTAFEALRALPARIDGRLFPFKDDHCVSRAFRRAVERAGIPDFRLHDLRHSFASYAAMAGTPQRGLQGLLGHKDGRMTGRYTHLSDAFMKAAVGKLALGAEKAPQADASAARSS
jgi:integrase